MGRGRVVLERIENKINRQVTFSKRRNGLLKKAYELSVLCDAEVALIMFSSRGKLSQFSSNDIDKTLERYRRSSYTSNGIFEHEETLYEEILKLRGNCESLQRSQKHFLGEDIEQLKMKELQHLEELIDRTLSQTRQRKTSMMVEKIEELRRKEQYLVEVNKELTSKKMEAINLRVDTLRENLVESQTTLKIGGIKMLEQANRSNGSICKRRRSHRKLAASGFFVL